MDANVFLLFSLLLVGVVFIFALPGKKPTTTKPPAAEVSRWKRFRVHFGSLHEPHAEPAALVTEEPGGLKLLAGPRTESQRRLQVLSGGQAVIELARGALFANDRFRVLLQGKDWLKVRRPRPGEKKPQLQFLSPLDAFELQGNLPGREFEVRRKGRLVANVSWQRPEGDSGPRKEYVLESVKGEDPLPLVALVLAVENALGPAK